LLAAAASRFKMEGFVVLAIPLVLTLSTGFRQANAESSALNNVSAKNKTQATQGEAKRKDPALVATIGAPQASTMPSQSSGNREIDNYFSDFTSSQKKHKLAHAASTVKIYAPQSVVWKVLIDFERYPKMFKRIDTCHITKKENGLIFAESYLKPQMFVKRLCQHTVTDISQGPAYLRWKMLDGNFKSVVGTWDLRPAPGTAMHPQMCIAKYTLWADPGPIIPAPLVSFLLHTIEHEVVSSFKKSCEQEYQNHSNQAGSKP